MLSSSDHYDSLIVAILFLSYPVYVMLITLATFLLSAHWTAPLLLLVIPASAWAYVQLKQQLDLPFDEDMPGTEETSELIASVTKEEEQTL